MLQISRSGLKVTGSSEELRALRAEFDTRHCMKISNFIEPAFAELIKTRIENSEFYDRAHAEIARELCMSPNDLLGVLQFCFNGPELFRRIEQITGCARIGSFLGRVYRMTSGGTHYDNWHSDADEERLAGISVNLSPVPYQGGVFEIRNSGGPVYQMPNTGFGDAIIFRIAKGYDHRVTPMEGPAPKTAYAGWFKNIPHPHPLFQR